MNKKKKNLYQQTQALLCKNLLLKWRMKRQTFLEWGLPICWVLYMGLISSFSMHTYIPESPSRDLGRLDRYNDSGLTFAYTPVSDITQQIMNKTATASVLKGRKIIGVPDEKAMDALFRENGIFMAAVVFSDTFSYKLKFLQGYAIPFLIEGFSASCWEGYNEISCSQHTYWKKTFVGLQAAIDAAIIEITTNHSVMEALMSVTGRNMKILPFISKDIFQDETIILYCLIYFSSFIYFASLSVTKERKKLKDLMKMMGLQDSAFWLSWGLIYAGFIFIISILISIAITSAQVIIATDFMVIFTLFFLYGLSLIPLVFLMCVLVKRSTLTNLVVFLLTLFWALVGLAALQKQLPASLEWTLSICSPFAFTAGLAQIIRLDYNIYDVILPDSAGYSYIAGTFSMLVFDGLLYLVLALYFDRILPYGNERRYSPLFFLNSWSCFQNQRTGSKFIEKELDSENPTDDYFEPVAPEFQGKEAIRIRNLTKEYKGKTGKVDALKGLFLDIYEGQITAILGHRGAGKSSLLNILNGLSVPTEGSVTIYNRNLSEMQDLEEIRKIIGVCPQFNVHIDMLTVKENLGLFAKIKGIQSQQVEQEVQRIVSELDLQSIQDNLAKNLSGGQKRKLTFGIAILGDPQVLLLDEPTAGLDPFSRYQVWNFLKERKSDHVILLSTNFPDEADILADRKVIMSNGRLRCAGSSFFLKKKWGLGYHLSLYKNEACDPEKITSLVNHHIPDAKLRMERKEKLVYALPLKRTDVFPDLFKDLEMCFGQEVVNYDVSMSALDEVLMKVEGKSSINQEVEPEDVQRDSGRLEEVDTPCPSLPEMHKAVSGLALWRQQVWTIARLRLLKLKHGKRELLTLLLVFAIALFPLLMEDLLNAIVNRKSELEFKPELYFLSPGQLPKEPHTSLLIINNTGSDIEDFIHSLKHQNIVLEVDDFENRNGTEDVSYNGAIIVSGKQKDYRFSVVCNIKRLHCFPLLMNIVSNGLLGMFNVTKHIRVRRDSTIDRFMNLWTELPDGSIFLFFIVCTISPHIARSSVSDYKNKAQGLLWMSGLYPSAYWLGQALVDINLYIVILFLMYLYLFLKKKAYLFIPIRTTFALAATSLGSAASLVIFTYVITFIFHKKRKNSFWSFFFFLRHYEHYGTSEDENYDMTGVDAFVCLIPYFQAMVFLFILKFLESKYGKRTMQKDPIFRIHPQRTVGHPSLEEVVDENEDEDVQAERLRTTTILTTSNTDERPVIIANCLHKEYVSKMKCCFSKKKKVAARNISFCVKKGEILGLLGPNGAGKSSTIRVIAGITKPTAGRVELKGSNSIWDQQEDSTVKFLGYCPQEDALWPNLTVREHLEIYTSVKGLRRGDAEAAISRLVVAFNLQALVKVPVQKLTAGTRRMLCFILSVLGSPAVLLLDEPASGLDPASQRRMWQTVQAAVKNTNGGALIITHHLAEAEALCDRVAIMVSGRLRYIGPIGHLKRKFGKDYLLQLQVKEPSQVTLVHAEILKLFPQAMRQERYTSRLAYKLPLEDVHPLSQAFHRLEGVKRNFNLEEYSLSQCTLEQIFLELSKEQEREDVEEVDTTMRWKLLSQSDNP
ncbi:PREDICTED: ATP-binding cassette sub-family A member 6 [Elephantulus edwardii]|uniref:ATP-binding cassette sub-family A member 6 n=1 Tax=Elephantulus edwardii TaxID=28737 RepID=UPI0003F0E44F|nr:PREDICTED: ATP-binding cassette sub-family A member 6 [Elephantulus edwardii]